MPIACGKTVASAGAGDAVQRLVPPVVVGDAEPRDRRRVVHQLRRPSRRASCGRRGPWHAPRSRATGPGRGRWRLRAPRGLRSRPAPAAGPAPPATAAATDSAMQDMHEPRTIVDGAGRSERPWAAGVTPPGTSASSSSPIRRGCDRAPSGSRPRGSTGRGTPCRACARRGRQIGGVPLDAVDQVDAEGRLARREPEARGVAEPPARARTVHLAEADDRRAPHAGLFAVAFVISATRVSQSARRSGSDTPSRKPLTLLAVGTVFAAATLAFAAAAFAAMGPPRSPDVRRPTWPDSPPWPSLRRSAWCGARCARSGRAWPGRRRLRRWGARPARRRAGPTCRRRSPASWRAPP